MASNEETNAAKATDHVTTMLVEMTTSLGRFVYTGIFEANPMASDMKSSRMELQPHPYDLSSTPPGFSC
ncbi:hypothetical protein Tco_1379100 [Tanacetum coccineum]